MFHLRKLKNQSSSALLSPSTAQKLGECLNKDSQLLFIMIKGMILILLTLAFILTSCEGIVGETEKIAVNLKCGEIPLGSLMLDMSPEEGIKYSCDQACLEYNMKYSGSYSCQASTNLLVCGCIVTPERREQLKMAENLKKQEGMEEAAWKATNPGKLSDNEAKEICRNLCGEKFSVANNINHNFVECGCNNRQNYNIDYQTRQPINNEEVQKRIEAWKSKSKCHTETAEYANQIFHNGDLILTGKKLSELVSVTVGSGTTYTIQINNKLPVNITLNLTYDRYSKWYGVDDHAVNVFKTVEAKSNLSFNDSKFDNNLGKAALEYATISNLQYTFTEPNVISTNKTGISNSIEVCD